MTKRNSNKTPWLSIGVGVIALTCAFSAQSTQVSARIKAVTCVMNLDLAGAGSDIKWNVGLTTRSDNTSSVAGGPALLKRKAVLSFSDPSFTQVDPVTGENYDCTKATGGIRFLFKAKDRTVTGDPRSGAIPDVNTGDRYFEYFVTYKTSELIAATGGTSTTLTPPASAGQYKGEDVIPLTGNPQGGDELKLSFTGGVGTLGHYPFYIWLVDDYQNATTAPNIAAPINQYASSITLTATYL